MRRSEEWLKKCDPECEQKSVFPKCPMCDVALEYRQAIKVEEKAAMTIIPESEEGE